MFKRCSVAVSFFSELACFDFQWFAVSAGVLMKNKGAAFIIVVIQWRSLVVFACFHIDAGAVSDHEQAANGPDYDRIGAPKGDY